MEPLHRIHSRTTRDAEKLSDGTMFTPNLPVELHGAIVNELKDEKDALKQCALTCRLYRHLAQELLFKSIEHTYYPYRNPIEKFHDILKNSPQIAHYVQRLSLRESGEPVDERYVETESHRDEVIPLVFPALVNLVKLSLRGPSLFNGFRLAAMKASTQLAIMVKCASLTSLTLAFVDCAPLEIFGSLNHLERLYLKNVYFVNKNGWIPYAHLAPRIKDIRLADVYLDQPRGLYNFFMEHKFAEGLLETLAISVNLESSYLTVARDFEAVRWFIRHSARTLKVLKVAISEEDLPLPLLNQKPAFDVSEMPLVEHLTLSCIDMPLKSITLSPMLLGTEEVAEGVLDFGFLEYFERFITDMVLSQTKSLSIIFTLVKGKNNEDMRPVEDQIRKHLPTLDALNLLTFKDTP
ncbi:hypothetical protein CPC08DRAFT_90652 [Agrocybe pediades]|nr:hypothetical protein CPC08DRAFT_90652 [Agrocybe pediades]